MSVERHHSQEENVGAYLLSALTEIETRAFEKHLEECPVCRDEIDRLRPAVDALPRSVSPVSAPPSLKQSLMAVVSEEAREARGEPRGEGFARRMREKLAGLSGSMAGMQPGVAGAVASVVLLAGIVAGGAGVYAVTQASDDGGSGGGSRIVAAKVDKTEVPLASGSLVLSDRTKDGAVLRVHGLPTLDSKSTYQVWLHRDGEVISQSLFSVGEDGEGAAAVTDDVENAQAVMITREPAGGARAPSEKPVLSVRL